MVKAQVSKLRVQGSGLWQASIDLTQPLPCVQEFYELTCWSI